MPSKPIASCLPTASRIAVSSAARSCAALSSPRRQRARVSASTAGRSRLPTWSARNGGFSMPYFLRATRRFAAPAVLPLARPAFLAGALRAAARARRFGVDRMPAGLSTKS